MIKQKMSELFYRVSRDGLLFKIARRGEGSNKLNLISLITQKVDVTVITEHPLRAT